MKTRCPALVCAALLAGVTAAAAAPGDVGAGLAPAREGARPSPTSSQNGAAATAADRNHAWALMAAARSDLAAASPLATDFVQSYTPSGFSVADEESGVLTMRLLDGAAEGTEECVRWDYEEPFPKGFLLCDRVAWAWNPGEESGRRQIVGRSDGFGLDLLRLSVEQLRSSYEATSAAVDDDRIEVRLVPTAGGAAGEIRDATFEIDAGSGRLLALGYHDVEGNRTRFTLGDYRSLDDAERAFSPPAGIAWLDD